ncbi:uncharacterized protein LOC111330216 isoform X2 [Stylophora pistillata]|uniref:uncharacterized protein LOC111330216 isoform X2 n=1 Tax=Stylophora pistillata TaxID=50429 RepID=UPI000C0409D4|nr:uncharacterized protein LOC111330216 isoform X2 [Stylophora pistillata]
MIRIQIHFSGFFTIAMGMGDDDQAMEEEMVELEAMEVMPMPLAVMAVLEEAMGDMEVRPQEVMAELEAMEVMPMPLAVMAVTEMVATEVFGFPEKGILKRSVMMSESRCGGKLPDFSSDVELGS